MKTTVADPGEEKKGHLCPPSNATHPSDRWESLFVYGFICKFTQLRGKAEGLDSPMAFEEALLMREANPIMTQILSRFVLNLRPQTRNLSSDVISSTVASLLQEYFKTNERTVFWDDTRHANVDPFSQMQEGFFAAEWDLKLRILRQLVELQLTHGTEIKKTIDRAWGVIHNKHKKVEATMQPPSADDPYSQQNLQLVPLGQDKDRKRYWVIDDSPRVYVSTNPWKITATFQAVSSTRDEYAALLQKITVAAPEDTKGGKTKLENAHLALLKSLQERVEIIDNELARLQRARRKMEQRHLLIAAAELRETRTRKRTTRPDYAYMNDPEDEDDADEYVYQADEDKDDEGYGEQREDDDVDGFRRGSRRAASGRRRSARATQSNGTKKRPNDEWAEWRGERRSSRLGASADTQLDAPAPKRARTEESLVSEPAPAPPPTNGLKIKVNGAAAIKPTETAVDVVPGKKKSKFWFYAVEPVLGAPPLVHNPLPPPSEGASSSVASRSDDIEMAHGEIRHPSTTPSGSAIDDLYEKSIGGSLSPSPSGDES